MENVRVISPHCVLPYSLLSSLPTFSSLVNSDDFISSDDSSYLVGFSGDHPWQRDGSCTDGLPRLQSSEHFLEFGLRK